MKTETAKHLIHCDSNNHNSRGNFSLIKSLYHWIITQQHQSLWCAVRKAEQGNLIDGLRAKIRDLLAASDVAGPVQAASETQITHDARDIFSARQSTSVLNAKALSLTGDASSGGDNQARNFLADAAIAFTFSGLAADKFLLNAEASALAEAANHLGALIRTVQSCEKAAASADGDKIADIGLAIIIDSL